MTNHERIAELERSHDELRGALIAAGRQLRLYPKNLRSAKLLAQLRDTLRQARIVRYGPTGKRPKKVSA